jgi:hypothetical protein
MMDQSKFFTVGEVGRRLGMTAKVVQRLGEKGGLPGLVPSGRQGPDPVFDRAEIEAWFARVKAAFEQ